MGVQRELGIESFKEKIFDELEPGTSLKNGKYICRSFLGADGFGITYLASDSSDGSLAIKECFPGAFCCREGALVLPRSPGHAAEVKSIVRLFAREARNLSKLGHPNIVGIRNVFEENNTAYIAMDFVNGRDLSEFIQDDTDQLSPEQIRRYLEKLIEAVGFVHGCGMLHRDITPGNIIIRQDDEPVLIDFGAAREQATKASRILSVLRVVKEGYSPQEFYLSDSEQNPSCDLYSMAASFYHVITGELPPGSQQRLAACASGQTDPYVPLAERTTRFDTKFCAALDKAISILPDNRFQSAEEWLEAMRPEIAVVETTMRPRIEPRRVDIQKHPESSPGERLDESSSDERPKMLSCDMIAIDLSSAETHIEPFADGIAKKTSSGRMLRLLQGSAAIAATVGAVLVVQPQLLGKTGGFEVLALAPAINTPPTIAADTHAIPRMASFQPIARSETLALWVPETLTEAHGISEASLPAPDVAEPQTDEGVDIAALTSPVQSQEPLPEREMTNPDVSGATTLDDTSGAAQAPAETGISFMSANGLATVTEAPADSATTRGIASSPGEIVIPVEKTETEVQTAAAVNPTPEAGMMSSATDPVLPSTASPSEPGLIGAIPADAPSWMASDIQVGSVNGTPIEMLDQASAAVADGLSADMTEVEDAMGVFGRLDEKPIDPNFEAPVVHDINLPNGLGFQSQFENGVWVTRVTKATEDWGLVEGDVMIGFVRTSQRIDGPETLEQIILAELAEGRLGLAFAVEREGLMWVETFMLSSS